MRGQTLLEFQAHHGRIGILAEGLPKGAAGAADDIDSVVHVYPFGEYANFGVTGAYGVVNETHSVGTCAATLSVSAGRR